MTTRSHHYGCRDSQPSCNKPKGGGSYGAFGDLDRSRSGVTSFPVRNGGNFHREYVFSATGSWRTRGIRLDARAVGEALDNEISSLYLARAVLGTPSRQARSRSLSSAVPAQPVKPSTPEALTARGTR